MVVDSGAFSGSLENLVLGIFQIVLIDLVLAGDNAVVIAMAVRSLPRKKRRFGIIFGAGLAVILRVALTFFASQLLQINFVKACRGFVNILDRMQTAASRRSRCRTLGVRQPPYGMRSG